MLYLVAAWLTFAVHLAFILFVVFGALLVARYPRVAWLHGPSVLWGGVAAMRGWVCPLTPLENRLRERAGAEGYDMGFIEHYLMPLIYPSGLTANLQMAMGVGVLVINLVVYGLILAAAHRARRDARPCSTP